jgi:hypothetical protein
LPSVGVNPVIDSTEIAKLLVTYGGINEIPEDERKAFLDDLDSQTE